VNTGSNQEPNLPYGGFTEGVHLFPFRTEQLSPSWPMVLGHNPGRVGSRRLIDPANFLAGFFLPQNLFKRVSIYLGAAGYLTGASNLRKRSRDSTIVQPLDDDAKVEDASEK
jgi:hypothetical protein